MDTVEFELLGFKRFLVATCILAIFVALSAGYFAIESEATGIATYHYGAGKTSKHETVTRESAPSKFREATDRNWEISAIGLVVGVVGFVLYRKIAA